MRHDLVVIGGGPGGYVAAIRAAQLGMQAAVVEKEDRLGGTCLRVGCIPSKALLESSHRYEEACHHLASHGVRVAGVSLDLAAMMRRKADVVATLAKGIDGLLAKNKVTRYRGIGRLAGPGRVAVTAADGAVTLVETPRVVLAVGSESIVLPGIEIDGTHVGTSTEALDYGEVPGHLVVVGGGYIGLELGLVYHKLGTEVRVLEFMDRVLPGMEEELSKEMARMLKKKKVEVFTKTKAVGFKKGKNGLEVTAEVEGKAQVFECDVVLSCVGRRPSGKNLGLEAVGVKVDDRGFVPVDHRRQTNVPGIYAIGDVAGQPMLAHKGSHEGLVAAAAIAGDKGAAYDPACIPAVIFTDPEIASVGLTADEARKAGFDPVEGRFPFGASGRAMSLNETDGWVKVIGDRKTDKLLGVHMIGPEVTELVAEAALAIEMGATVGDLAQTIHAHPTLAEAMMEAAEAVHSMAVHIFQAPKNH